jgi:hypothetical protein
MGPELLGVWLHCPPAHASWVQPTSSSQSLMLQQLPQVAVLRSALGQHFEPSAQSGLVLHLPPSHEPT